MLLAMAAHASNPCITSSHGDGSARNELRFVARGVGILCMCSALSFRVPLRFGGSQPPQGITEYQRDNAKV
jgi:hypothetical protein